MIGAGKRKNQSQQSRPLLHTAGVVSLIPRMNNTTCPPPCWRTRKRVSCCITSTKLTQHGIELEFPCKTIAAVSFTRHQVSCILKASQTPTLTMLRKGYSRSTKMGEGDNGFSPFWLSPEKGRSERPIHVARIVISWSLLPLWFGYILCYCINRLPSQNNPGHIIDHSILQSYLHSASL